MKNEDQVTQRLAAVKYAVAMQRVEGLTVSPAAVSIMEQAARGEMTDADSVVKILAMYQHPKK